MTVEDVRRYMRMMSQSLFYWIIYSYKTLHAYDGNYRTRLNPYFTGLSILIAITLTVIFFIQKVSILILLDYLFLLRVYFDEDDIPNP